MKKKDQLIIFGTGQHAKVCIDNIEDQGKYKIFGLVTNKKDEVNKSVNGHKIVCLDNDIKKLISENKDIKNYFLGFGPSSGSMQKRFDMYTKLDKILNPVNIIHPLSLISKYSKIGKGNVIEAYAKICNNVILGNHCLISSFSCINHDQQISDNVFISGHVGLTGTSVGFGTIISEGAIVGLKKKIGKNCLIGENSFVNRNIPDNTLVTGNPPKLIKINKKILKMLSGALLKNISDGK